MFWQSKVQIQFSLFGQHLSLTSVDKDVGDKVLVLVYTFFALELRSFVGANINATSPFNLGLAVEAVCHVAWKK